MNKREAIVLFVCVAAIFVCGWSLWRPTKHQLFGSEAIRLRLRIPHWLVMFGSVLAILGILASAWFTVLGKPVIRPNDPVFLSLATVLVLFMLFGFVGFEAGGVSSAYRNESTEKNLLVIMFSLAAYLCIGRFIYDGFAPKPPVELTGWIFQAGFACTVSLIISNALTERASKPTNVLCAIFSAGLGYPFLAGLVWGDLGLLHNIGFVDASGANAVHLLGASASLTALAMVGPRVRLQRWRFLGGPETPDFRSTWTIVGGLFLFFGWLGFNSGNAPPVLHGHAFYNTTVGAFSGALAAWSLSRGIGLFMSSRAFERAESEQTTLKKSIDGLNDRPRVVIGMMGGLVAVTANGYLGEVSASMAALESAVGGLVAVLVSTWMSARSRSGQIDDPLGVIGTHGCAAIVGILSTALWLAIAEAREGIPALQRPPMPFWPQLAAHLSVQVIGCGVCIVIGWLVAMVPCWLLLTIERRALTTGDRMAAKFRLRLGAIEQLGTPLETPQSLTPQDVLWKYQVKEAARRIIDGVEGDTEWWEAVRTYAKAAELLDTSKQGDIAQRIVNKLEDTADDPDRERIALVALGSSAEFKADDIRSALAECLSRAKSNGNGHAGINVPNGAKPSRQEWLVWSIALLTERAAVLNEARITNLLPDVHRGLDYLREVTKSDENPMVQYLARTGVIDSNFVLRYKVDIPQNYNGSFDHEARLKIVYALVADKTALPMLLFLADRGSAMIADAKEEFKRTHEDMLETARLLDSHGLISLDAQKMTIKDAGLQLVTRLRQSGDTHESL